MKIKLYPIDKDEIINKLYIACRTCYNAGSPVDMYNSEIIDPHTEEQKIKLIKHVLDSSHLSVMEHVSLTFFIEGVSRALTHQLVRHRQGISFSQQSQRYCEFKNGFTYVTPDKIQLNKDAISLFNRTMNEINDAYLKLISLGIPAEDARAVLPNACCSNITVTVNLRELMHICNERLCSCAQHEIRKLIKEMTNEVVNILPFMKNYLVPKCVMLGYCNESKTRSCGRMPIKGE